MRRSAIRLLLTLLAAGVASVLAGLALVEIVRRAPCHGEILGCNIEQAIGAYLVFIWAVLGPLIFGVTLLVGRNRTALLGAMLVLLAPLLAGFAIAKFDSWRYIGFEPYPDFRTFLVAFVPAIATVAVQYLVLRLAVPASASPSIETIPTQ